jgi:hypothetical protein
MVPRTLGTISTDGNDCMHSTHRPRTRLKGERGYVLVMSALLMLPLLAFAGFAIDVGSWYAHANRMQRAADAAALAGVVWMPNDEKAEQIALETARANGFDDAAANISVTVTPVGNRRLRVDIHDTEVKMYMASLFLDQVDIQRQALAEYVQAVPMGSPDNTLGNDPDRWSAAGYARPYYWLNVAGPNVEKHQGDRYTANTCTGSTFISNCTAISSSGQNLDYSDSGYFYRLNIDTKPASGNLTVQVFDPAFTSAESSCSGNNLPADDATWTTNATTIYNQGYTGLPSATAVRDRYVEGNTTYCVPDRPLDVDSGALRTTYLVRAPDNTPFDNYDNPVVCAKTFDAYDQSVYQLLHQSDGLPTGVGDGAVGRENMRFPEHFRRWTTICDISWGSVAYGDYLIQVNSTNDLSNAPTSLVDHDPLVDTGGQNRFAMRAGFGTPGGATYASGISLFADGRLPIYVNVSDASATTNFYLARIVPEYAGQLLELELFDLADGAALDLTIQPPADMTGGPIGTCTFIRDATTPVITTSSTCTTHATSDAFNARVVTIQVPLPDTYGCNAGSDLGCWFKVLLDYENSATPTDQTTWSARVRGDPVRLVE